MSAAAVIVLRRKRLIRAFRQAGDTDREHAATLAQLNQRRSWIFDQMERNGVFLAAGAGRYYLNARAADAFQASCRRQAMIITVILLGIFLVLWLVGGLTR